MIAGYDPGRNHGGAVFDAKRARFAVEFFHECLHFTTGEWRGRPFVLQDWQRPVIENLFGWVMPDGTRRYRECFIYVPRKNGKTELAAGIAVLLAYADNEPGAQVYCAAAAEKQAREVFTAVKTMVVSEPQLMGRSTMYQSAVTVPDTGAVVRVISATAHTHYGMNVHGGIIDELHAHPKRDLVDVIRTSTGARRQPLIVYLTTADYDRESICNDLYQYAVKVRDGDVDDPEFMPVIYESPREADWADPGVWASANPSLGVTVKREYIERECRKAKESPTLENSFRRLHLNQKTEQDMRWLRMDDWNACDRAIDEDEIVGQPSWAGLDLSSTQDVTAFVVACLGDDGLVTLIPRFWIPSDNAHKRERRDRVPYTVWARQGFVVMTPGNSIDYEHIYGEIQELCERFGVQGVGIDPWNGVKPAMDLQARGVPVELYGQGYGDMTAPCRELERLLVSRKLRHGNHPVLKAHAGNVTVKDNSEGSIRPSKGKSTQRIDGIVAAVMAIGLMLKAPIVPEWDGVIEFV